MCPEAYLAHAAALAEAAAGARGGAWGPRGRREAALARARQARRRELARAYERYQALLAAAGLIDFGDQVSPGAAAAARVARGPRTLQRRFKYILVDEFQDTNRAQAELVELLAEPHRNVTVVGDDDQSIYKFRGAAISNILEFRERYPRARQVVLRRNYRSRAPILDATLPADPLQRPGPARGPRRDRQAAGRRHAGRRARPGPPRGVRHRDGGGGLDRRRRSRAGSRAGRGRATSRSWCAPTRTPDPVLRCLNLEGDPVALLRDVGPVRAAGDPAAARVPARDRGSGSSVDVYALAASDVYGLGGDGPDGDRPDRAPAHRTRSCGGRSRSWAAAGPPAAGAARRGPRWSGSSRTSGASRARPRAAGRRGARTRSCARAGWLSGSPSAETVAAEEALSEHRPVLRHRPRPVGAARRTTGSSSWRGTSRR